MNSFQQPVAAEPGGATWHKVANPTTGWFASKTTGWVADRFSDTPTDCLTVDFSAVVPAGTRAVKVLIRKEGVAGGDTYARAGGDTNISNTPAASSEFACRILGIDGTTGYVDVVDLDLSATYTVDIAVTNTSADIYVAYPKAYLL